MSESLEPQTEHLTTNEADESSKKLADRYLPFSSWMPILLGALSGVSLRLIFGGYYAQPYMPMKGQLYSPMSSAFILLAPVMTGAVTVYVAERMARRSWRYYAGSGALASVLFVLGTMVILIEGFICAIIIAPLFAVLGALGGLFMGAICRATTWRNRTLAGIVVLPLSCGAIQPDLSQHLLMGDIERSIVIQASPEQIWHALHNAQNIKPQEFDQGLIYRIGVPLPLSGVTHQTAKGLERTVEMGKSIHFKQVATEWEVNRYVRWKYEFAEDSFPPNALDDHVKIGGDYFDLIDTEYRITPLVQKDAPASKLTIRIHYRLSTEFNWYASPVAQLLIGNFEDVVLRFYGNRSASSTSK